MNLIAKTVEHARDVARDNRRKLFTKYFELNASTTILDLGSADGSYVHRILEGCDVTPENITIADIDAAQLERGASRYGFRTCHIEEGGCLPFGDDSFDIVFSNSAIEHVTIPKAQVWAVRGTRAFRNAAWLRQQEFAKEVRRVGRGYFVQTPHKGFFIESHTWLPGFGWLPRPLLLPALRATNRYWIKKTAPDWALLGKKELRQLFPDGEVLVERFGFMTKSIIAAKKP